MKKILILIFCLTFSVQAYPQNGHRSEGRLDFTHAARVSTPAVVHIKTYATFVPGTAQNPLQELFEEYFGQPFPGDRSQPDEPQGQQAEPEPELYASGSGVIISKDGFIITSNHIIENAERIDVILNDKRTYTAELIGTDQATDVALLKVLAEDLPTIPFGNSDSIEVGDWVVAVGNPFNLTSTVTAGIVSAKGRNINVLGDQTGLAIEAFIQTDAAVNPGNSGGALVDPEGRLVGINTAIASPTGAFTGYSFAVPVNLVKKVVQDLREYGLVQRGLLGVMIRDIDADLAKENGLQSYAGVYVAEVNENSAASEAGIRKGDVILEVNGIAVNSPAQLQELIALQRPGDEVDLKIKRDGKIREVKAVLKSRTGGTELVRYDPKSAENRAGATFSDLSKEELQNLNVSAGVRVTDIRAAGKFRQAGVREGFVITHIDKKKVSTAEEVRKRIEKVKEGGILVEGVYPGGERGYYAIGF